MKRRGQGARIAALLVATATALLVGGFGDMAVAQSSSASSSKGPVTFTYADTQEPSSLNPMVGYLGTDYTIWAINYDIPVNFNTTNFAPDFSHSIVTAVQPSTDGLTFTYTLRSGMKWSDGQPFTANDVCWTLNYYKANNVPNYSSDLQLMRPNGCSVTDSTHFVLHSSKPTSFYSGKSVFLYEYILPQHIWGKYQNDYHAARQVLNNTPQEAVGSGPFIIQKYVKGQYVELDKNPLYWGDSVGLTPHVDRIIYRIYGSQDAEAAGLQNGEVDFGYFTSANILNTLISKGLTGRGAVIPSFGEIGINTGSAWETNPTGGFKPHGDGSKALTDVYLRQAMRMAVDNSVLVNKVLQNYGSPWTSPVQPTATTGKWSPAPTDPNLNFNIAGANQLLQQHGYKLQNPGSPPSASNLYISPITHQPLEFRFYSRSSDQPSQDIVPYVQGWFGQIGIKLDPQTLTSGKLGNVILEGNYDLFEWGWYPNPDPNYILNIFTCAQRPPNASVYRNSDSYYCNPAYDKLDEQQSTVTDPAQRVTIVRKMQDILYTDEPYLVLWNDATLEAWNQHKWTGFLPQPSPNGDVLATYGPYSFISLRPATRSTSGSGSSSGVSPIVWIAIGAVVIIVLGIVVFSRRGRSEEDEA
jgi:peptide/nickel transport system substrate-binding protein